MAAAVYTTDLVTVNILDTTTPAVAEPTGSVAGTTIAVETDHYVVGTACIAKIFNATGIGGLGFQNATAVTVPTDGAIYMWTNFLAPNAIDVQANGGMQILVGNTIANYKRFYIYGDDNVPYGGWQVNAVNPANTASATQGTPTTTWQYFGIAANVQAAVARGYPLAWDAVRAGRGSIIATNGDLANGYATFAAIATKNDLNVPGDENRWGIFSFGNGTYTLQGRLALGSAGTAVDFRDSNRAIFIKNTEFVTAAFNQIEIINAGSRVDWIGISISSLGTLSKGSLLVTDNATVNLEACTFTDMSTFTLLSNTSVVDSTFRRCELITHGNGVFNGNLIEDSPATIALTTTNLGNIQNCTFISAGTGHAIQITVPGSYTFTGNSFTNYGATGTTNAAIYNNSGGAVTITISGGSSPTFRNGVGASTTVVSGATVTFTGLPTGTDVVILTAGTNTILDQVDSNVGTTYAWGYSGTPTVDVGFIKTGFVPYYIRNLALSSSNSSIPVAMSADRNFT